MIAELIIALLFAYCLVTNPAGTIASMLAVLLACLALAMIGAAGYAAWWGIDRALSLTSADTIGAVTALLSVVCFVVFVRTAARNRR